MAVGISMKIFYHRDKRNASLYLFASNFSDNYETSLMQTGKIKKLQGQKEELYRLKLRSYRLIYKKEDDRLVIYVIHLTTRESAYK